MPSRQGEGKQVKRSRNLARAHNGLTELTVTNIRIIEITGERGGGGGCVSHNAPG